MKKRMICVLSLLLLLLAGCGAKEPEPIPASPTPEPVTEAWKRYLTEELPWEKECAGVSVSAWPGGRLQARHSENPKADAETLRKLLTDAEWTPVTEQSDDPIVYTLEVGWKQTGTKLRLGFRENGQVQSSVNDDESTFAVRDWETLRAGLEELRLSLYVRPEEDTEGWMEMFPWEDCTELLYITRGSKGEYFYRKSEAPKADAEAIHGILKEAVWELPTCGNRNSDLYIMRLTWADGSFVTLRISDAGEVAYPKDANTPWMITRDSLILEKIGALAEAALPPASGDAVRRWIDRIPWEDCAAITISNRWQIRYSIDPQADAAALRELFAASNWYDPGQRSGSRQDYIVKLDWKPERKDRELVLVFTENGELTDESICSGGLPAVRDWEPFREKLEAIRLCMEPLPEYDAQGWMETLPWEDCVDVIYLIRNDEGHEYRKAEDPQADAAALRRLLRENVWELPDYTIWKGRIDSPCAVRLIRSDGTGVTLRISDTGAVAELQNIERPWMMTEELTILEKIGALAEAAPPMG